MKTIKTILDSTRASFSRVINRLTNRMAEAENTIICQNNRLKDLEKSDELNLSNMEVVEDNRKTEIVDHRKTLNQDELRLDLEKQYGKSTWAEKVIDEIIN